MTIWAADVGRYHFVISHENGTNLKPEDRAEWVGYTASFKSYEGREQPPVRIDGRWDVFTAAEAACVARWRQLRNLN